MFHNEARPKAMFTMWLQCHGKLLTVDRLVLWRMQLNTTCALCQAAVWRMCFLNGTMDKANGMAKDSICSDQHLAADV